MSSTRAGLPRYIKTPVIPNWISPHVDSTVQQAAVFGPHIGILDFFALLLVSVHCSASLHKSESKSEAKRMSHCSPSLIWSRGAYACWWMLVGEVLGTSGWSGLEASKPGSSVPADDRSPAWTGREGRSNWRLSTTHRCGFYYTLWLALLNHAYMHTIEAFADNAMKTAPQQIQNILLLALQLYKNTRREILGLS